MHSVLPFILAVALAAPLAASDLRGTLSAMAADAGVTVIIDRAVQGSVETRDLTGDSHAKLDAVIARAGLNAVRVELPDGKPVLAIRLGEPTAPVSVERAGTHAGHTHDAPPGDGHKPARIRRTRAHTGPRVHAVAVAPPPIQLDAMVVSVAPGAVAELSAFGRELAPLATRPSEGTEFLDGPGPGLKMLAFDRVEPRLNEHLPWGEVGTHRDGVYEIRRRHSVLIPAGAAAQVPLYASKVLEEPTHRETIIKQALVVRPEVLPSGRIRLEIRLRKGVAFPDDIDPSMLSGGRFGFTTEIAMGQEVLVTGLGVAAPPAEHDRPERADPFERFYRPRLRDFDHNRRHDQAPACGGQIVVRLLARPAITSVAP